MTSLGTLPGDTESNGYAINGSGQVTGFSRGPNDDRAYLYSNGVMTNLGTLGGRSSIGSALNDAGQVTGASYTVGDAGLHAFLYTGGVMMDLGSLGASRVLVRESTTWVW